MIAGAVEEQSVTTSLITENVKQASRGIQEVSSNIAQSASAANQIAQDIVGITEESENIYVLIGSISGACGGSASYSIRGDSNTGVFSGNLSFNSFCEDGMTINGTSTFNGVLDPNTGELESFVFSFDNITGTSSTESFAMDGDIDFTVSGSSIIMTMDMLIQCNGPNTYKVENFQMTVTEGSGYTEIAVSGRFYDPAYGYVTLSTPSASPFLVSWDADYPYSGELVLEGAIGASGSPTHARLTAVSATTCQVVADTDGDGDYDDYDSGPMAWTDI